MVARRQVALLLVAARDIAGMSDVYRVRADRRHADARQRRSITHEYWAAPSPTDEHDRLHGARRDGAQWWRHGHSHIDESEIWLVHIRRRRMPQLRSRHDRRARRALWPMWSPRRRDALLHVRSRRGSENIWTRAAQRWRGATAHALHETAACCGRPSRTTAGRSSSSATSASGRSTSPAARRSEVADHAARCAGRSRRRAPDAHRWLPVSSALSPDGKKVAFVAHGEVFAASAKDGGDATRVTTTPEREEQIAWAPDSRRLVYSRDRDGAVAHLPLRLRHARRDAAHRRRRERRLADVVARRQARSRSCATRRELRVLDVATKQDRSARDGIARAARHSCPITPIAWSPDSQWIAYLTGGRRSNSRTSSCRRRRRRRRRAPVSFPAERQTADLSSWSPDGTYLLFDTAQRTEDGADRAHRSRPAHAEVPRGSVPRSLPRNRTRPAGTPTSSPRRRASSRRSATRATVRADSTRGARPTDRRDDRLRRHSPARQLLPSASTWRRRRSAPTARRCCSIARAAGQTNLYVYSLDELSREPASRGSSRRRPASRARAVLARQQGGLLPRERARSTSSTSSRGDAHRRRHARSWTSTSRARSWRCSTRRGAFLRDNFFDPKMHGVDWKARATHEYEPYVARRASTGRDAPHHEPHGRRAERVALGHQRPELVAAADTRPARRALRPRRVRARRQAARSARSSRSARRRWPAINARRLPASPSTARASTRTRTSTRCSLYTIGKPRRAHGQRERRRERRRATSRVRPVNVGTEAGCSIAIGSRAPRLRRTGSATADSATCTCRTWAQARSTSSTSISTPRTRHAKASSSTSATTTAASSTRTRSTCFARRGYLQFTPRGLRTVPGRSIARPACAREADGARHQPALAVRRRGFHEGYRALKLGKVVGEPTAGWIIYTSNVTLLDGSSASACRSRASPTRTGRTWRCIRGRSTCWSATDRRELQREGFAARCGGRRAAQAHDENRSTVIANNNMTRVILRSMATKDLLILAVGAAVVCVASTAGAQRQVPAAVQHNFDLVRPLFSGQKAYDQTAFMDQYFRWPGNTGFNASIHRVEGILKAAGYVEESSAKPGEILTYRIEHRPMRTPAWEPVDATVTIGGEGGPAAFRHQSQHAGDQFVFDARHWRVRASRRRGQGQRRRLRQGVGQRKDRAR